jgi:hypothetical protein
MSTTQGYRIRIESDRDRAGLWFERTPVHPVASRRVIALSLALGALAALVAVVGLLWEGTGGPTPVETIRGEAAELFGRGLYSDDTTFIAGNNRASDLVMLVAGLPLLAVSLHLYTKGSLRARLLLLGTQGFFLYVGASYALGGVAYNEMFLAYVALFSAGLFAFVVTFLSFTTNDLRWAARPDLPRRLVGRFMIASGVVTFAIWVMDPVASLLSGDPPKTLDSYSTLFTHAFDLAVIVPGALVAGVMILRGRGFGYVVAFSLLVLEALLLPLIAIATYVQVDLGIHFEPGEIVAKIGGFSILAIVSVLAIVTVLRRVPTMGGSGSPG